MADPIQRLGFDFTEEQLLVRDAARTFAQGRLAPGAAARDHGASFPSEFLTELSEMGLLAMQVSFDDGGAGADHVGYVLALESVAESCASTAALLASSNLAATVLSRHGTAEQKMRWLLPYAEGKLGPATLSLAEPNASADVSAIETVAERHGDGWVLRGRKAWVPGAAHAGLHLVLAKTNPADGVDGIGCFVLEATAAGLSVAEPSDDMGLRSAGRCTLTLDACVVGNDHLLGTAGAGHTIALSALSTGRIGMAAQSLGIAEAALHEGLTYVHDRTAFGKRIFDFQNTQFKLADCRTRLDASWLLSLRAAKLLDQGKGADAETAMAKLYASEACGHIVDQAVQMHGGYGYSREYAVERYYRDARITRIAQGSSEHQRALIAREMSREVG